MSFLSEKKSSALIARIQQLSPESTPLWGTMTVEEMLVHCVAGVQMAFGDFPSKVRVPAHKAFLARILYVELLPLPKHAPAPAEINLKKKLTQRLPFEEGRRLLLEQIKRLTNAPHNQPLVPHPIFRRLSKRQWRILAYKHLDHHLRQFGV